MRKNLILCTGVALTLVFASTGFAGDYHTGLTLKCQQCHVMHYSQSHGYNPDGSGNFVALNDGPNTYLLRDDINDLCLSCHDGEFWAPDVFEEHTNGYVRQGGGLNDLNSSGDYEPESGHTLNSTDTAPGGTFANADGLHCGNCHAVHGSNPFGVNSYRNLGGYGTGAGSYPYAPPISYSRGDVEITNVDTLWVFEDASSGTNAAHYGVGAIIFNEPDETKSAYGDFCKNCHTDFHGDVGGVEIDGSLTGHFYRHPAGGVDIGDIGGGHSRDTVLASRTNQVQVMSPDGVRAGSYTAAEDNLTPSCMSCHKGHGNMNAFGLIYMSGTGTITEEGDDGSELRDLCKQCHGQGG